MNSDKYSTDLNTLNRNVFQPLYTEVPREVWKTSAVPGQRSEVRIELQLANLVYDCLDHHLCEQDLTPWGTGEFINLDSTNPICKERINFLFFEEYASPENIYDGKSIIYDTIHEDEDDTGGTDFNTLYSYVTDVNLAPSHVVSRAICQNRVSIVAGDVGAGKTLLMSHIMHRAWRKLNEEITDNEGSRRERSKNNILIPIYYSHEDELRNRPININILHTVSNFVVNKLRDFSLNNLKVDFNVLGKEVDVVEDTFMRLKRMLKVIADHNCRVLIVIDNIDAISYAESRYNFDPKNYEDYITRLGEKVSSLVGAFYNTGVIGSSSLAVCIALRSNILSEINTRFGVWPHQDAVSSTCIFRLKDSDVKDVLRPRVEMFNGLLGKVVKDWSASRAKDQQGGKDTQANLEEWRILLNHILILDNKDKLTYSNGFRRIKFLFHHGSRSAVEFFRNLTVSRGNAAPIIQRFTNDKPWQLERLYIANVKGRFTQEEGHFPNIFLVDGAITEAAERRVVHEWSYWLKYIILRHLMLCGPERGYGCTVDELTAEIGPSGLGFDTGILWLAIGSLSQVNESRCIEIVNSTPTKINAVRLTNRGKVIIGVGHDTPLCFELSYLQLVTDDYLLSAPAVFREKLETDTSLKYLFYHANMYRESVKSDAIKKLPAAIRLMCLLETAWKFECFNDSNISISKSLKYLPDFDEQFNQLKTIYTAVARKCGVLDDSGNPVSGFESFDDLCKFRNDQKLIEAFSNYRTKVRNLKTQRYIEEID